MAYDLKARLQELVAEDSARARDRDILYRMLRKELEGKELALFGVLLNDFIAHHVRRPGPPARRSHKRAEQAPGQEVAAPQQRAMIMEAAGKRPLFLPALVTATNDGWVAYDEMTDANWREYISSRQRVARVSEGLAKWGSANLQALHEYNAPSSGKLPPNVRESLLRRMPHSATKELEAHSA